MRTVFASFFTLLVGLSISDVSAQQLLIHPIEADAGFAIGSGNHNQLRPEFSTPSAAFQQATVELPSGIYLRGLNVISMDEMEGGEYGGGNKTHFYAGFKRTLQGLEVNTSVAFQKIWNVRETASDSKMGSLVYVAFPHIGNYQPYVYAGTDLLQNVLDVDDPELITSGIGIKFDVPVSGDLSIFGYQENGKLRRFFRATGGLSSEFPYGDRTLDLSVEGGLDKELGDDALTEDHEFLVLVKLSATL
ncbi:MAG: hypothetical protein OYG31_03265 [Candidatus Kaiserbacteria bacterium]|nr:hypothetical protein [Candidatus Kaiserbacteria bacterium]